LARGSSQATTIFGRPPPFGYPRSGQVCTVAGMPDSHDAALRAAIEAAGGLLYTTAELGEVLGISQQAVAKQVKRGREAGDWGTLPLPVAMRGGEHPVWTRGGAERARMNRSAQTDSSNSLWSAPGARPPILPTSWVPSRAGGGGIHLRGHWPVIAQGCDDRRPGLQPRLFSAVDDRQSVGFHDGSDRALERVGQLLPRHAGTHPHVKARQHGIHAVIGLQERKLAA
jgi:hypothetical protein